MSVAKITLLSLLKQHTRRIHECEFSCPISPFKSVEYSALIHANLWIQKCPLSVQNMDVTGCYFEDDMVNYGLILQALNDTPTCSDRYGSMLKTQLEILANLSY